MKAFIDEIVKHESDVNPAPRIAPKNYLIYPNNKKQYLKITGICNHCKKASKTAGKYEITIKKKPEPNCDVVLVEVIRTEHDHSHLKLSQPPVHPLVHHLTQLHHQTQHIQTQHIQTQHIQTQNLNVHQLAQSQTQRNITISSDFRSWKTLNSTINASSSWRLSRKIPKSSNFNSRQFG